MPRLSIVIPTLGMYETLRRVLDRYATQDAAPGSFEVVVVVDRADPDPSAAHEAVGERPYPVRVLRGPIPGVSANRNVGWRSAEAPVVLFTDNDTLPEPSMVTEHVEWHRRHSEPEVGVLGHVRWSRQVRVTPFMHWLDRGIQFDYPNIVGTEAGWGRFYTANVSLKRTMIERTGDFDQERLPYGYEDLDFAYRASRHGLRLLYNRRAVVEHLREMDLEFYKRRVRRIAVAERQFVRKHPEIPPYFFEKFSRAAEAPQTRGRAARLAGIVPRSVPWLGSRVWSSADMAYRQALAPHFLEAWQQAADSGDRPAQPDLSERGPAAGAREGESSGGSPPSGP